jgi:membrane-bound inhibitor of C-type lysozyme
MKKTIFSNAPALPLIAALALAGCGSLDVWPFGGEKLTERSRVPANAAEFVCAGGKRFHVRYLDGDAAAWLILPDREVRLDKSAGAGSRYSNGITTLAVDAGTATLTDRGTTLTDCKTPAGAGK